MVREAQIDAAARAIFDVVEARINRTKQRAWGDLTDYRKQAYRDEAAAALNAGLDASASSENAAHKACQKSSSINILSE